MKFYEFVQNTACGLVRTRNEDALFAASERGLGLFAVADGMGGHEDGDVASRLVIEELSRCWEGLLRQRSGLTGEIAEEMLRRALEHANSRIYARSAQGQVCGSTVVVVFLWEQGYLLFHAGDSRAYLYTGRLRPLRRLTEDHTWENFQRGRGQLSVGEIRRSPLREKLIQAVGATETLRLSMRTGELHPGQGLLLCSDGVYKHLGNAKLRRWTGCFSRGKEGEPALQKLFEGVYANGAPDNLSAVMIRLRAK